MSAPTETIESVEFTASMSKLVHRSFGEPRFHTDHDVCALAFSSDGNLWSIDESGLLLQWDRTGKQLKRTFLSDIETLWAFSPGAKFLASGNDDLLLWDVGEGQLLRRISQPSWVTAIAFSPDNRLVASGHDDGTVRFWDVHTQKLTGTLSAHAHPISAIAFTNDGNRVATAGEDRVVRVWDAASHKCLAELVSHTDRIPSLSWSPDGKLLISAGWDRSARVWKLPDTQPVMLLNSHADQVVQCAFSPDGSVLACADSDYDIYLWSNAENATHKHVLSGHVDEIRTLAFDAKGQFLASAGADRIIHLWDVREGKLVAGPQPKAKHDIAVVPEPLPMLASTGSTELELWTVAKGEPVSVPGNASANAVASSPDGHWLAVGGSDHFTRLYDVRTPGSAPKMLEATKPPIGAVAFSPDSSFLAHTSPADGLVWIWNPETANPDLILVEAADGCTLETLAIHADNIRIAVGGIDYLSTGERDGAVCIWDRTTKLKVATYDTGVYHLAFDPADRFLAGAGLTDRVHIWDLAGDSEIFALEGHTDRINAVGFSPDGSYLVSSSDDRTIRIWDVLSGRLIVVREFDSPVLSLAFSPDGKYLFTGNGNTTCSQFEFQKLVNE